MKMALSDDSPSSQAVLFSILSLSALHHPASNSKDVINFKACALKALRECASRGNLTLVQTMQHMAAAILLCRIEVSHVWSFKNEHYHPSLAPKGFKANSWRSIRSVFSLLLLHCGAYLSVERTQS